MPQRTAKEPPFTDDWVAAAHDDVILGLIDVDKTHGMGVVDDPCVAWTGSGH
jgi:hypothetical protein